MTRTRSGFELALISGLILFLELACIRWFPAHVPFLSFFSNTVLLACFLGMSVGCLIARKPTRHLRFTPVWLTLALTCGLLVGHYFHKLERHLDVGNQANPEVVFFGTETSSLKPVEFLVPVEVIAGGFFFLIAVSLVGPGQELGRAFNRVPIRSQAYGLNLVGSLVGIALFAGCSALSLPPVVWFLAVALGLGYFLLQGTVPPGAEHPMEMQSGRGVAVKPLIGLAVVVLLTVVTSGIGDRSIVNAWSPYYRIRMNPQDRIITTNLISHQVMTPRSAGSNSAYDLPYLFARETGRQPYQRILIIGAGSGNDVSRALYWSSPDARIDAVEIDPTIRAIGGAYHPDRPYADPRVTTHLNDGRTFLRTAPAAEYDLVIFALVDSLVLHSGASNIRLESYLFTQEAFADVARVLKPTGTAAVYNFFRQGWIIARLRDAARDAFGTEPIILTDPPADHVALARFDSGFTAVFAGHAAAMNPLRDRFAHSSNSFWIPNHEPITTETPCRFGPEAPAQGNWIRLRAATVEESADLPPATDDWPFLYVRKPTVPSQTWRGTALVLVLSLAVWWLFRDRTRRNRVETNPTIADEETSHQSRDRGLVIRSFLLGGGFMLIETRAVVEMALLFGSTWVVNTVVFAAVLIMSLLGNRWAAWIKPRKLWPYYIGLLVSFGINVLIPVEVFLGWPRAGQILVACLLTFTPIAFAGVIFAVSFERSPAADRMFAANVAGALFGGLAENASLLLGFRWLLLIAGGVYLISSLFREQSCPYTPQSAVYNEDGIWIRRIRLGRIGRRMRIGSPNGSPVDITSSGNTNV